jgi:hypothetical protein
MHLHDVTGAGGLVEQDRNASAAAEGIALSVVAETVAANYRAYQDNAERLMELQARARETASVIKQSAPEVARLCRPPSQASWKCETIRLVRFLFVKYCLKSRV